MKKKKIKSLEEIDCPYIKKCGFKDSRFLYSCRKGGYNDCSIYLSNIREKENEK